MRAGLHVSAALLVARRWVGRWTGRARLAVAAVVTIAFVVVTVPAVAALAFLIHVM